jgi:hypothetical protein
MGHHIPVSSRARRIEFIPAFCDHSAAPVPASAQSARHNNRPTTAKHHCQMQDSFGKYTCLSHTASFRPVPVSDTRTKNNFYWNTTIATLNVNRPVNPALPFASSVLT